MQCLLKTNAEVKGIVITFLTFIFLKKYIFRMVVGSIKCFWCHDVMK